MQIPCKSCLFTPSLGTTVAYFLSSRKIFLRSILFPTFPTTKYFCDYTCQNPWLFSPLPALCHCLFLPSRWYAYCSCLLLQSYLKHNAKALCKTHPHQERTEQIFTLWDHMHLGEKITVGNCFCKTWCFWKPVRGEEPKSLTHSSFSDFVLREKDFNITVWESTVSSKGSRSPKSTVTAVRKLSVLLSRMLCSPIHN